MGTHSLCLQDKNVHFHPLIILFFILNFFDYFQSEISINLSARQMSCEKTRKTPLIEHKGKCPIVADRPCSARVSRVPLNLVVHDVCHALFPSMHYICHAHVRPKFLSFCRLCLLFKPTQILFFTRTFRFHLLCL